MKTNQKWTRCTQRGESQEEEKESQSEVKWWYERRAYVHERTYLCDNEKGEKERD